MCAHRSKYGRHRERERERETLKFIPKVHLLAFYQLCTYLLSQNKDSIIKWLESWAWGKKSGTHPPEGSLSSFGQWEENNHSGLWDHFPFISSTKSPISPTLAHQSLRTFIHYLSKKPYGLKPRFPSCGSLDEPWLSKKKKKKKCCPLSIPHTYHQVSISELWVETCRLRPSFKICPFNWVGFAKVGMAERADLS